MMFRASFFAAPHRVMFLGGTVQALLAMGFWSLQTGGHYAGFWPVPIWPLLTVLPQSVWHALLMGSGVFPWFIYGFILTAGPGWQGAGDLGQREFLLPFLTLATGWVFVWAGLLAPVALSVGLVIVFAGWVMVARILTRIAMLPAIGREHIAYAALATWLGAAGIGAYVVQAASDDVFWGRLGLSLTIWGFLMPVFVTVTHRMLPFFTSAATRGYVARRPVWALRILLAGSIAHGALSAFDQRDLIWLVDFPAMLAAGTLSWLWWQRGMTGNRMVAVLHGALAWLGAFGVWAFAYAPALWRPRADGQSG
ncbi:MAG: NnrS family protein [Rhodocyclales bacterium]|nr:NnrS family protein [Rhodocyclales bacterium]